MNVRTRVRMDKAQFFDWLERQDRKHELADGRVVVLPYVTRPHSQICTNVVLALGAHLDPARFGIHGGEFAIGYRGPQHPVCRHHGRTVH